MPDKSLETLAQEWLNHHVWNLPAERAKMMADTLVTLLRSRDARARRIVEDVCPTSPVCDDCAEIKRRLEADDG